MENSRNAVKLPIRTYRNSVDYHESSQTDSKPNDPNYPSNEELVMYATSWCGYCKKARKYLKENRISYTEYDIEADPDAKARYDQMGAPGVPLFLVGEKKMTGFNEQAFERFYR